MRSEEGARGPGAAVSGRASSWREKPAAAEAPGRRESPRREPATACGGGGAGQPREEKRMALSKVVLRRLPPGLTKEQLEEQLRPLPAHDYFEVVAADLSLYPHLYSRAYINFRNPDDILLFRDRFDGYIFIGNKGLEYPAVVEFAPFQKIAKKKLKKKDAKTGSIEDARRTTPLLEYIKNRKLEKQRIREEKREERRRKELEKKRLREEEKRKRREEERCKRKEAEKQKRTEKEIVFGVSGKTAAVLKVFKEHSVIKKMEVFQELRKPSASLECDHCGFRGTDYENIQIHMGTIHPEFCDDMDTGGLGKMIFYQKSAKLFHCHKCFFTSKMYSNVYYHITSKHATPEKWSDKPKNQMNKEIDPVKSPSLPEYQNTSANPAELRSAPALPIETQKLGPGLSAESPSPVSLEPPNAGPVVSPELQAPCLPAESSKPAPVSSPECPEIAPVVSELQKPDPVPSPEPQKPVTLSPEPVKAALASPKPQKHSPFADTAPPTSALSPESPVLAASPEPWGPSPTASPESRKPARSVSPEPKKPSPSVSPELWKPFPAISPEPRRPAPAVSPGSWKPGPPGSPRPWKSSPSATSGPWKSTKPAPSVSPGPWKPIPSISPGPWKPTPSVSPASWKSSSGSWKTPPTSPESWKSGPPELRKTAPTLSPEHWKAVPPVSPELRRPGPPLSPEIRSPAGSPELKKPSVSPDLWKLSPDQRKTSASLDFSESQKSSCGGPPDLWKSSFIMESQKSNIFPETRKPGPSGPSDSPKVASDIWKPVLSIDAEPRKSTLFPEPTKTVPPASPEPRKRVLFPEPRKHALFSELPKSAVFSEAQKATELGDELQLEAIDDAKCDSLVQEELLSTPKRLLEESLFPSSKKLKKDSQENSDAELSSSEYIRTDLDNIDIKGQESSSDQEQVDVESIDFSKENKMDMSSPEQSKNVLQFTEEKEAFISEEEIAKYMKRGKGKYYCKICCCRAMKKGAVLHHLVNKHNVHSPYKCTICGKAFLLESLLKNHVAAHGQSLLKCPRCNFESNFPRGFKKHLTHCQSRHNEEANKKLMEALESPLEEPQL